MSPALQETTNLQALARLFYLCVELHQEIPKLLLRYLPWNTVLEKAHQGIYSAAAFSSADPATLETLYHSGSKGGSPLLEELKAIVGFFIDAALVEQNVAWTHRAKVYSYLFNWIQSANLLEEEIFALDASEGEPAEIEKFPSGFAPLDAVLEGCYTGILTLLGKTGTGKTSLCCSLMESFRKIHAAAEILLVNNEIPGQLMLSRLTPVRRRTTFLPADRIICASWSSPEILNYVTLHPQRDRIIIFDSPDVQSVASGLERRFQLEQAYQTLVTLKRHAKLIVVTSQMNRKSGGVASLEAIGESWAKAQYSDVVIGITSLGRDPKGRHRLKLKVLKDRFGPDGNETTFYYDYSTLLPAMVEREAQLPDADDVW